VNASIRLLRRLAAILPASLLLLLLAAPIALADIWSPESGGSPNADRIDTLYWIVFGIGIGVFILVESLLLYSVFKYRAKRGAPEPAQIHGNTRLEIGWTLAAIVLVLIITVVTFSFLPSIRTPDESGPDVRAVNGVMFAATDQPPVPGGEAITIGVTGQQYMWRYDYPDRGVYSYYDMVVPTNTTVVLKITSQDVQHSWWIPELGGKMDAYPGHFNETWFKIEEPGEFTGNCAELCGENHAQMYGKVTAVPPEQYRAWVARQAAAIKSSQQELARTRQQSEAADDQRGDSTVDG
jgi:cytochrome c oxidase subunit 2